MAWTDAQRFDFHMAQFRFGEESRRIKAQRGPEPEPTYHESDEEACVVSQEVTATYLEAMGHSPQEVGYLRAACRDVWQKLDTDRL